MKLLRGVATTLLCLFSVTQIWTQTTINCSSANGNREMRGIWVATVNNIDWPSAPNLSTAAKQKEAVAIIERVKKMGLNCIFLQVRPSCDVIYNSAIEPKTYFVSGESAATDTFDALDFWIEEAHLRGLELHAWINPFRVAPKLDYVCAENHVSKQHPDWTIKYSDKILLDPGRHETRQYIDSVICEIASNYDVDGIHFDDYFYPYPVKGETFVDTASYAANNPLNLSLEDWRRSNVDSVIKTTYNTIKRIKPWLKFGVSPFGVWRNQRDDSRGSDTRAGTTDYDVLYANVLEWVDKGWVDYVVPQLYWESGNKAANFDVLAKWWGDACSDKVQIYVGHSIFKINSGSKAWNKRGEMPAQIENVRNDVKLSGSVLFSYRQFNRNLLGLEQELAERIYAKPALTPFVPPTFAGNNPPVRGPQIDIYNLDKDNDTIFWTVNETCAPTRFFVIYRYPKGEPENEEVVAITGATHYALEPRNGKRRKFVFRIAATDIWGSEHKKSKPITVKY